MQILGTLVAIVAAPLVAAWGLVRFAGSYGLVRRIRRHRVDDAFVEDGQLVVVRAGTRTTHALGDLGKGQALLAGYVGFSSERGSGLLLELPPLVLGFPSSTHALQERLVTPLREAELVGETRPMLAQLVYPTLGNLVELAALALWIAVLVRLVV